MTKTSILTAAATLATLAIAAPGRGSHHDKSDRAGGYPGVSGHHSRSEAWSLKKFTSLVAFGDSYTDDSRLGYFASHNGSAPPVGWVNPAVRSQIRR
jgi:hypothetical protein